MKETEIGEEVVLWLREEHPRWEVYQEVKMNSGRTADIVCVNRDGSFPVIWVIELKTTLSLELLRQAYLWNVTYRSIAYPRAQKMNSRQKQDWWCNFALENMEIGSLQYSPKGIREYRLPPKKELNNYRTRDALVSLVKDYPEEGFGKAGTSHGGSWSKYRASMEKIKEFLRENPGQGAGDIVKVLGKLHYANEHSARGAIGRRLATVETDWCRTDTSGYFDRFYVKEEK